MRRSIPFLACLLVAGRLAAQSLGGSVSSGSSGPSSGFVSEGWRLRSIFTGSSLRTFYSQMASGSVVSELRSIERRACPTPNMIGDDFQKRYPQLTEQEAKEFGDVVHRFLMAQERLLDFMIDTATPDDEVELHGGERLNLLAVVFLAEVNLARGFRGAEILAHLKTDLARRSLAHAE